MRTAEALAAHVLSRRTGIKRADIQVGHHWKDRFVKRWSEWESKLSCRIDSSRAEASDRAVFEDFFVKVSVQNLYYINLYNELIKFALEHKPNS